VGVRRVIHRENPYVASRRADQLGRAAGTKDPDRAKFFAEREVLNTDGTYPFGEGFLYEEGPRRRARDWVRGHGKPGDVCAAGHRGTKREQQDAWGAVRLTVGAHDAAALVVADGVSASGELAKRASSTAVDVFLRRLEGELADLPEHRGKRHAFVEHALKRAAFAANFEIVRHVLFDGAGDGRFDAKDKRRLRVEHDVELPTGRLSPVRMRMLAPHLDEPIAALAEDDRHALTTFAVALAIDDDLYTFSSGDAVVSLYRPTEKQGERFVHLTHRDQAVVELLFDEQADLEEHDEVYENVITDSFGDSAHLTGTMRRYPGLLEPGDRVVVSSDGIGPRGDGRGLSRAGVEAAIGGADEGGRLARALVDAQLADLEDGEYQDNIAVAVLTVEGA
jgi:serine/threonine protein phosphatase PrpC